CRPISPSFCCRRSAQSSTRSRTSGSSCATTGSPTASSNPTTISSTIVVRHGTSSSISLGASCPSDCANGPTELGINLSRFETDRKFTKEEPARVRASLPKPEEPDLPVDPAQPQHENQTAERPDPTPSEATDFPQPDSREVREFFVTVAAQAKAATQHLRAP